MRTRAIKGYARGRRGTGAKAGAGSGVTPREIDVLRLMSQGCTYAEAASRLRMSVHTVASHVKKCYRKLGVHSAAAAVTRAAEMRLL